MPVTPAKKPKRSDSSDHLAKAVGTLPLDGDAAEGPPSPLPAADLEITQEEAAETRTPMKLDSEGATLVKQENFDESAFIPPAPRRASSE